MSRYPHWKINYTESTSAAMEKSRRRTLRASRRSAARQAACCTDYRCWNASPQNQTQNITRFRYRARKAINVSDQVPAKPPVNRHRAASWRAGRRCWCCVTTTSS
ncbi:hypothetical protein KCP73_19325 [Salmonella enterica subsp. enterica]|nr:hypothetical protein KCP73_19325 [Salmonella enterica subsp. enterica]